MSTPAPSWLALATMTETDKGHEAPFVMQVILNRLRAPGFGDTLEEVILQPWQFSYFNPWTKFGVPDDTDAVFQETYRTKARGAQRRWTLFLRCAEAMLELPEDCPILPPKTLNYWSPVSMLPKGSLPRGWNWNILKCFEVPGIDPRRFIWAETVKAGSRGTGKPSRYEGWAD